MSRPLWIYTCTPVAFRATPHFFTRDTGLISTVLRRAGIESRTIMPLPGYEEDRSELLLRTDASNLRSARWWKAQNLDAVILYSWGDPRYTLVARAIHRAGIRLILQMDFNGHFLKAERFPRVLRTFLIDLLRSRHLSYADVISASPVAESYFRSRRMYGRSIAAKCRTMPTAVDPAFSYDGRAKERRIICVGRWDDPLKRPAYMLETLKQLLKRDTDVRVDVCGTFPGECRELLQDFPPDSISRINILGELSHDALPYYFNRAQISLCTSESEGTHTVSAEALCCGCSVVTPDRDRLRMVRWYTTHRSGTIAGVDTPEALADALCAELNEWRNGNRKAAGIATYWQPLFRADLALPRILKEAGITQPG